jgi:hypothetical protein
VRVGEEEEGVEEAVGVSGAGAADQGLRLREEEELGERGVERVDEGEAQGGGSGVSGPGASGGGLRL